MSYTNKYSLCFQPDDAFIEIIKQMKLQLAEKIGWYNSKNALAHITIAEFQMNEDEVEKLLLLASKCCSTFNPTTIQLSQFNSFPNGAFYLSVDDPAKQILKTYSKKLMDILKIKNAYKSAEPHLSIARKLNSLKLQTAFETFDTPSLSFICSKIALRRLHKERLQFDTLTTFPFLSQEEDAPQQLVLF